MHIESHSTNEPQPVPLRWSGERLYIDLYEANHRLLTAFDVDAATAAALARVWQPINSYRFLDPRDRDSITGDFIGTFPPPELHSRHRYYPVPFAADVRAAGAKLTIATIHTDRPNNAFVGAERVIQAVAVSESISVTEVVSPLSFGYAERAGAKPRVSRSETFVIQPGNYLLCWTTCFGLPLLRSAAYVEQVPSEVQVATAPGFGARELFAACDKCGQSWTARDGIARFEPNDDGGQPWNFAGRRGAVTARICREARCMGAVHITNLRHPRH
jgi:hypothetical protein